MWHISFIRRDQRAVWLERPGSDGRNKLIGDGGPAARSWHLYGGLHSGDDRFRRGVVDHMARVRHGEKGARWH
jgi:hypothetical protein